MAGVVGGERDKVGLEVSVAGEEGEMHNRAESWEGKGGNVMRFGFRSYLRPALTQNLQYLIIKFITPVTCVLL